MRGGYLFIPPIQVRDEVGAPCVVVGQSNLCAVALEAAEMGGTDGMVTGVVLIGPPLTPTLTPKPLAYP